ncbi:hypothetical protein Tco_0842208 [Tanacetum coccineum]|uniref:Uncharacterized protein n=1 Tax=Tanacetum coccineum TaxID=301880 RepID=A0ABQ5AYM2_9ASTR
MAPLDSQSLYISGSAPSTEETLVVIVTFRIESHVRRSSNRAIGRHSNYGSIAPKAPTEDYEGRILIPGNCGNYFELRHFHGFIELAAGGNFFLATMPRWNILFRALLLRLRRTIDSTTAPAPALSKQGMDECLALRSRCASINLIHLQTGKKRSLPDLTPSCMTLNLRIRSISIPMEIAKRQISGITRNLGPTQDFIWKEDYATRGSNIKEVPGDVCTARKLSTFSKLATMDPPGDIMVQTSQPKRSLTPEKLQVDEMTQKLHPSLWKIFDIGTGIDFMGPPSRSHEGTSIFSWQRLFVQHGLKRTALPPNDAPSSLQISEISLRPDFVLPVLS